MRIENYEREMDKIQKAVANLVLGTVPSRNADARAEELIDEINIAVQAGVSDAARNSAHPLMPQYIREIEAI